MNKKKNTRRPKPKVQNGKKLPRSEMLRQAGLQTERRYLTILSELPDIIYKITPSGIFTFVNKSVRILGYKPKDLIGKHFSKIVHPEDVKLFGRRYVLPRYRGKKTGNEKAPKLFDERRTGKRKTENLQIRLIPKKCKKKSEHATELHIGEVIAFGDVSSIGYYDTKINKNKKKFLGTLGIIRDVTVRKQIESKLHYQADLLEHVSDAIISTDIDFNIRTWNNAAEKMYGWKIHEVEGKPVHKVTKLRYPHDNQNAVVKQLLKTGEWRGEVTQQTKDGRAMNILTSVVLLKDYHGIPLGTVALNRDITSLKKTEEKLRLSEEKYRHIVESAPDGIVTVNKKGIITSINTPFCQRTGFSKEQIVGKHISKIPTARLQDIPKFIKMFSALLRGKIPELFEFRWVHRDKSVHWGEVRVSRMKANGKIVGYQAITRDITDRKANEEARRLSDEKLSLAVEAAGLGLWDQNFKTHTVYRNEQWAKMLGYTTKELEPHPKAWLELIHPDDESMVKEMIHKHENGSTPVFDVEHRLRTKQGQWRWIRNWGKIVERDKKGKPLRAQGVHLDITERKQAEKALWESEEKYSSVVENSKDAIIIVHQSGIIKFVNQATMHLTGFSENDFINRNIMEFIAPQYQKLVAQRFAARLKKQDVPNIYEIKVIGKDGKPMPVEINASIIEYQGNQADLVFIRDISGRKATEAEIKQRNDELAAINAVSVAVSQSLDLNSIMYDALDKILEILHLDAGGIHIVDFDTNTVELVAQRGVSEEYMNALRILTLDAQTLKKAAEAGKAGTFVLPLHALLKNRKTLMKILSAIRKEKLNLKYARTILLYAKDKTVGLLAVANRKRRQFSLQEEHLLTLFANQIAVAILNAQLYEESRKEITERQNIEDRIMQQNTFLKNVLEAINYPFYVINAQDYTIQLHNSAASLQPLSKSTKCYRHIYNSDKPCAESHRPCPLRKTMETKKPSMTEHIHIDKNGHRSYMEVSCFPVFDKDGKVVRAIEYYVDITARKEIEDSLKTSINEKEALLKEVHHRVKNNLQIISSLLNLQARQITDKHYHDIFKENQNRIKSMVLVHEKLYQSKNLASIDPDNYIKSLVTYLFHAYGVSTENVALITDIKTEKINADTAIPYGIIINELVSNCLKHAFPPPQGGKPEIKIRIFTDKTNTTHLTVKDNGKGIPEQTDLENAGTLGLQLVNALVQQLGGTMKCSRNNGTTFDISIDQQLMNEENEK